LTSPAVIRHMPHWLLLLVAHGLTLSSTQFIRVNAPARLPDAEEFVTVLNDAQEEVSRSGKDCVEVLIRIRKSPPLKFFNASVISRKVSAPRGRSFQPALTG
jgi:hypothetical protein